MNMAEVIHLRRLRGTVKENESMARHVSWRAGGKAARLYVPADREDLAEYLRSMPASEPILMVGLGSNLLVRDGGFHGTVILTHRPGLRPQIQHGAIVAEAGVASPKIARFAARNDFEGAEFLSGVPGTLGGALAMNAGCFGSEAWDVIDDVLTIDRAGNFRQRPRSDFVVAYRSCELRSGGTIGTDEWFICARLRLAKGHGPRARDKIRQLLLRRIATQPLSLPNAGSVFRNPPDDYAARLIESCGLKGLSCGGAQVSGKHANFIVNPKGEAKAADIEALITMVRDHVRAATGVDLIPEVRIVGVSE